MRRGQIVLVDTNIIIEAIRTKCWKGLKGHFQMRTVEKCFEEAATGRAHRPGYIEVDEDDMYGLLVHKVKEIELASIHMRNVGADRIDEGERHLWAHGLGCDDAWVAVSADHAAINVALQLGWADRLVSLEQLAKAIGAKPALKDHFSARRLSEWRTEFLLQGGKK